MSPNLPLNPAPYYLKKNPTLQQAENGRYLDGYEYGKAVTRPYQYDDSQTWIIRAEGADTQFGAQRAALR